MLEDKQCTKCKEVKPVSMFNKWSLSKSGYASSCKSCRSIDRKANAVAIAKQKRAWYDRNVEHVANKGKQARKDDPQKYKEKEAAKYIKFADKILARALEYHRINPESNKRAAKKYRLANPHLSCKRAAKRRSQKLKATPLWAEDEFEQLFIFEIYHLAKLRRDIGLDYHVDHSVPLIAEDVCGLHCAANLQLLPAKENMSKSNKYWPDMW